MSRARWISLGVLVLLLALLPFLPRGGGDDGALRPSGHEGRGTHGAWTAGYGRLTASDRREIDRVVSSGATQGRLTPTMSPRVLAGRLVRCASFEGQRYCLGSGWTDSTTAEVRDRTAAEAAREVARPTHRFTTGDLSLVDQLRQRARMSPAALAAAETRELRQAARSVAKVWLIRHDVQGVPLPPHFRARHPEVVPEQPSRPRDPVTLPHLARGATNPTVAPTTPTPSPTTSPTTSPTSAPTTSPTGVPTTTPSPTTTVPTTPTDTPSPMQVKHWRDYPTKARLLKGVDTAEQTRTYWCGPTSMQMITWGWKGVDLGQDHWAWKLGTTTSGTSITSMVEVVNNSTGWDRKTYAGPYVVLDISDFTFRQWMVLMARHLVDYRAPVVLHPVLLTEYYPYLDHDGSGHFQVGRGYRKREGKMPLLGYFEPWNQQLFHPDEPFIDRVQWQSAYKSYRANQAHFQHNLGV